MLDRRGFVLGALAAPAVIRFGVLMPVKPVEFVGSFSGPSISIVSGWGMDHSGTYDIVNGQRTNFRPHPPARPMEDSPVIAVYRSIFGNEFPLS
jgi:hypothetical protein